VAIYDTEEEQIEQFKRWWSVNQTAIIVGVITAIVIVSGANFWQRYQQDKHTQASQAFQELLDNAAKNNLDAVEKIAEKLNKEYATSAYAQFASLELAKIKVQKGDLEAAKAILDNQIKTSDSDEIKHLARLRLIELDIATKQYEQGLQLISAVDPAKSEGFAANYDELQGDIYVALDRLDEARSAYQSAIRTGQATPLIQFKLDDIAAPAFPATPAK
jgi:predicted negative regulator of RcsB-dependent stress response